MAKEVFDYDHFNMVIEHVLKIKSDIKSLKDIRSDVIESAIANDRNLDEFEVCFLNFLDKIIKEDEDRLNNFYKHIKAEDLNEV